MQPPQPSMQPPQPQMQTPQGGGYTLSVHGQGHGGGYGMGAGMGWQGPPGPFRGSRGGFPGAPWIPETSKQM